MQDSPSGVRLPMGGKGELVGGKVRSRRTGLLAALGGAALLLAYLIFQTVLAAGTARLGASLRDELSLTARAVESEIERFRYLPGVLAHDERIARVLDDENGATTAIASNHLLAIRDLSGADELFVMNEEGRTIAASNWRTPESFLGRNYSFRPYFRDAIALGNGRFYAVGVTTGKPGYFLSSVVVTGAGNRGVAVVKVDLEQLEAAWREAGVRLAIADRAGVIFLSGEPEWKYRPIGPIDPAVATELAKNRTYSGIDLDEKPPLFENAIDVREPAALNIGGGSLLFASQAMEADGWRLLTATPLAPVRQAAWISSATGILAALVAALGGFYWHQRRQLIRIKLDQHAMLENRVAERTRALAIEVEERIKKERELRQTQEGLIQAAKLAALGRMSAAIVHEVSQPLAAMENTLAAARLLSENGDGRAVAEKVEASRVLIKRMQRIVRHLKSFARKGGATVERIAPSGAVRAAIELARHRADEQGVVIGFKESHDSAKIDCNATRLEQVVLNLLLNALDAVREIENPQVNAVIGREGDTVVIKVGDNGHGVPEEIRDRITEPFFSTRETGEGLGLGLAISKAIVEDYGGALEYSASESGGSIFAVRLPARVPGNAEPAEALA